MSDIKTKRVRATAQGYGGIPVKLREIGEEFDVPAKTDSRDTVATWFVDVATKKPEAKPDADKLVG